MQDNLLMAMNVLEAAQLSGVKKLLYLASSCMYPKLCPQPMREENLLSGPFEPSTEPYALAKITATRLCQAYRKQYGFSAIVAIPTNLYGPNDNYDPDTSHVLPALVRKFREAKESGAPHITVWGTGRARREFMHADDLADACLFLM